MNTSLLKIGNTPLVKIKSLSDLTGCEIYAKSELSNPGGSIKDRTALGIINEAEQNSLIRPGDTLVEGTAGNTGIGIAMIAEKKNYKALIVMPNNQAQEKYDMLKSLGAELLTVAPVPFANENHFYHTAKRLASERPNSYWINQFENLANYRIHYTTTGPEIWNDLNGEIDAFVSASGTGGTIAGVSRFLKEKKPSLHIRLVDPLGSGLYSYVKSGKIESTGSSITEGIGIMRLTANFKEAIIDDAIQVNDQNMISMLFHIEKHDGLLVGTSSALNLYGAYQYALENKNSRKKIVTILCDSSLRYRSKLQSEKFLTEKGLVESSKLALS